MFKIKKLTFDISHAWTRWRLTFLKGIETNEFSSYSINHNNRKA